MNGENIPEAWDQEEQGANNLNPAMAGLNFNATPFVPNIGAAEFVPSFKKMQPDQVVAAAVPQKVEEPQIEMKSDEPKGAMGGPEPIVDHVQQAVIPSSDTPVTPEVETEVKEESQPVAKESLPPADKLQERNGGSSPEVEEVTRKKSKPVEIEKPEVKKDHLNVVFIGHVDAGKSTIGGQIMYLTGMVDKRTLEKYEREAKEKNRETWYLSWVVDTNQEERDKGKTVEVGRAYFETENKHFTILDAPGHRSFVPNMIGGASQADVAVLVISARRGEFETGFERGGQTREHAMLAKTAGVKHLVVLINKMDDPTVRWSVTRYDECKEKLTPFLKKIGFNPKNDIHFMPCSGLTGANLLKSDCSHKEWYTGLPLIPYLDKLPTMERSGEGPVRLPIVDKYKDMGTVVLGKLESGTLTRGMYVTMQPNKRRVKVLNILSDDVDTDEAIAGENVKLRLDNIEEDEVSKGFVLCSPDNLCCTGCIFDAQIAIIEYKSIICAGYSAILHIHTCIEEVEIKLLLCIIDRRTGEKQGRPKFVKQDQTVIARLQTTGAICIEDFKTFPQMGRFTLRDEGKTIAIGKVLKVLE